ncbi:hypothetical protein P7K49_019091 [Saguinus oedipus]|uniref:Uncharacterized protein n=1 Tax=Saguinus oedipus TaxID=9490 RepID=A0ABQ9UX98_SAGOE|nr:hypothetical protein P7K49_019091 [Saguinus oedipus]
MGTKGEDKETEQGQALRLGWGSCPGAHQGEGCREKPRLAGKAAREQRTEPWEERLQSRRHGWGPPGAGKTRDRSRVHSRALACDSAGQASALGLPGTGAARRASQRRWGMAPRSVNGGARTRGRGRPADPAAWRERKRRREFPGLRFAVGSRGRCGAKWGTRRGRREVACVLRPLPGGRLHSACRSWALTAWEASWAPGPCAPALPGPSGEAEARGVPVPPPPRHAFPPRPGSGKPCGALLRLLLARSVRALRGL